MALGDGYVIAADAVAIPELHHPKELREGVLEAARVLLQIWLGG